MQGFEITLKEVRDVADGTKLFLFGKPEGYTFQAGQYVALSVDQTVVPDARGSVRSLSIATAPYEPDLGFAMRQGESGFKQTMWRLQPGDTVTITKPVGSFVLPDESDVRPIVFLAGGIGITPVRSILLQAAHDGSRRQMTLLYSNRFMKDAAFEDELKAVALPDYRYVTVLSQSEDACAPENDERGYICDTVIGKYVANPRECLFYIVGSPQFSEAMEAVLAGMGIGKEQCKMDPFSGLRVQTVRSETAFAGR